GHSVATEIELDNRAVGIGAGGAEALHSDTVIVLLLPGQTAVRSGESRSAYRIVSRRRLSRPTARLILGRHCCSASAGIALTCGKSLGERGHPKAFLRTDAR